jgi:hypothetical protein
MLGHDPGRAYLPLDLRPGSYVASFYIWGNLMATNSFRIAKVQRTLEYFENDVPLLNMRVKELSREHQESAKKFAAAVIDQTRAELHRLLQEQPDDQHEASEPPCEPAD